MIIPLKTMKSFFYFIEKALFVLQILKFLQLYPFLSTRSTCKIDLHKFADVIFGITQKPF